MTNQQPVFQQTSAQQIPTERSRTVLLATCLLLGGAAEPLSSMFIEVLATYILVSMMVTRRAREVWSRAGFFGLALLVTVAIVELAPIPSALWMQLPGRMELATVNGNTQPAFRTVTLDSAATISTLLAALPGLVLYIGTLRSDDNHIGRNFRMIIAAAIISLLLGVFQDAGFSQAYIYLDGDNRYVTGLFANHNHACDLFIVAICLLTSFEARSASGSASRILKFSLGIAFATGAVLTASRFGLFTLMIVLLCLISRAGRRLYRDGRRSHVALGVAGVIGALPLALVAVQSARISEALQRFDLLGSELRPQIWRGAWDLAKTYFPVGSGLGTFESVYKTGERGFELTHPFINAAHNDYLQIAVEMPLLLVVFACIAGLLAVSLWKKAGADAQFRPAATLAVVTLCLHSAVDYPLRNAAFMAIAGVLAGALVRQSGHAHARP